MNKKMDGISDRVNKLEKRFNEQVEDNKGEKVNRTRDAFTGSVSIQNGYLFVHHNDNWYYLEVME